MKNYTITVNGNVYDVPQLQEKQQHRQLLRKRQEPEAFVWKPEQQERYLA